MKCPVCKNELINVYKVGYAHPAYSNCYDGLNLAEKTVDGSKIYWYEVSDYEGRALFLKRMKEIESIDSPSKVQQESNQSSARVQSESIKEINNQIVVSTQVPKLDKSQKKKAFLKVCLPYY